MEKSVPPSACLLQLVLPLLWAAVLIWPEQVSWIWLLAGLMAAVVGLAWAALAFRQRRIEASRFRWLLNGFLMLLLAGALAIPLSLMAGTGLLAVLGQSSADSALVRVASWQVPGVYLWVMMPVMLWYASRIARGCYLAWLFE